MIRVSFGVAVCYLALGIASLVISIMHPTVDCGASGEPPLRQWIFGTGIAYTIIGGCMLLASSLYHSSSYTKHALFIVLALAGLFTLAWTIVGGVTLWRDAADCQSINYPIWAMGMADVIVSIVLVVCTGGGLYLGRP